MAYCPSCYQNVQIIVSKSEPHCSNCFCIIQDPTIQSEDEYRRKHEVDLKLQKKWKIQALENRIDSLEKENDKMPSDSRVGAAVLGIVLGSITLYFFSLAKEVDINITRTFGSYLGYWFLTVVFGMMTIWPFNIAFSSSESFKKELAEYHKRKEDLLNMKKELEKLKSS